jgi:hypothetical protein
LELLVLSDFPIKGSFLTSLLTLCHNVCSCICGIREAFA